MVDRTQRLKLRDGLLVVFLRLHWVAGEVACGHFHGVAGDLHLLRERELVRGEAQGGEDIRVEILRLGVVGGHAEPLIELAELLFELGKGFAVHGRRGYAVSAHVATLTGSSALSCFRRPPPSKGGTTRPASMAAGGKIRDKQEEQCL